jgi:hypothetical protein
MVEEYQVVCGEWEVGSVPASWSGEQYNIVLDVIQIVPHPLYNVSAGKWIIQNFIVHYCLK